MKLLRKSIQIVLLCLSIPNAFAQLGFCNGNSGDPIIRETFGAGTTNVALPPGTTTYTFANSSPNDGFYTVSSSTNWFGWHDTLDHTPDDTNGRSLIVNADFTAGEFYRQTISGLCENTSYEFSSWLLNLLPINGCNGNGIPINVKFQIWDVTDSNLLASGDTGDIASTATAVWQQFGLTFQTLPGQTSIILKMVNNGIGGCGNDLAIDDIVFKACGDNLEIVDDNNENNIVTCSSNTPFNTTLTVIPDFSVFSSHNYQWQDSDNGSIFTDIAGATNQTLALNNVVATKYYRVRVVEDIVNLNNPQCAVFSAGFVVFIVQQPEPPISNGDVINCAGETNSISVAEAVDTSINWYDAPIGGNLLLAESSSFFSPISGIFYAEAVSQVINSNCASPTRTAISITYGASPIVEDEELSFCENGAITLDANIQNVTYLWSTGDTTSQITVNEAGLYSVTVTNAEGCSSTKNIMVSQREIPIIGSIVSDGNAIVVTTENTGDFEYSLDGLIYQLNPTFFNVEGGLYTVYVRERNGCGSTTEDYLHFWIPKFFTPNGDTENDTFDLKGIEFYNHSEVYIFDRYGRLLIKSKNTRFSWDGTFKNQPLPTSDYWYVINIDGQEFKGHFTLKR